jgi:hypothetical protein
VSKPPIAFSPRWWRLLFWIIRERRKAGPGLLAARLDEFTHNVRENLGDRPDPKVEARRKARKLPP